MIKALIHEKRGICVHCSSPISFDIVQQDQNIEYEISIYMIRSYKFIKLSKFIPCSTEYLITVGKVKFVSISPNNVLNAYKAEPQKKLLHFPN